MATPDIHITDIQITQLRVRGGRCTYRLTCRTCGWIRLAATYDRARLWHRLHLAQHANHGVHPDRGPQAQRNDPSSC
jgi:hypothetical protein